MTKKDIMTNEICENCGIKINVPETALKLCDKCFKEKCECGHIRAEHIDNNGSCIHEFSLQHKTKRGESCPCKKFKLLSKETPPKELTPKNVIYWSDHWKSLIVDGETADRNTIGIKARKFVKLGLIEYKKDEYIASNSCYICKPLPNCHLTHTLKWKKEFGDFECSCQYFQTKLLKKEKPYCSHYMALFLQLKIWNWNKRHEKK